MSCSQKNKAWSHGLPKLLDLNFMWGENLNWMACPNFVLDASRVAHPSSRSVGSTRRHTPIGNVINYYMKKLHPAMNSRVQQESDVSRAVPCGARAKVSRQSLQKCQTNKHDAFFFFFFFYVHSIQLSFTRPIIFPFLVIFPFFSSKHSYYNM